MQNESFFESAYIREAFSLVDMNTAGNNGAWVSMGDYRRMAVLLVKAAGTANDDPNFQLEQAQDGSGTGGKLLTIRKVWDNLGDADGGYTETDVNADEYIDTSSGEQAGVMGTEVLQSDLDDGFTHIRLRIDDDFAASQFGVGLYIGLHPRQAGNVKGF